jgi:rod shape-determining protein MreD
MKDRPSPTRRATARAIDILAERLPTVPPKPENAEKGAAPGTASPGTDAPATVAPGTVVPTNVATNERRTNDHRFRCQAQSRAPGSFRQQWRPAAAKNGNPVPSSGNWLRNFLWNSGKRHRNPGCESFRQAREGSGPNSLSPSPNRNPRSRILHTNVAITYTSGEQVEVYRFSIPATMLIPLIAVFLQAWLPLRFPFFNIFDLPLLVVIGFATARRNPLAGLVTGGLIGILQDALTHQPIGLYGISKTVVGFGASSLGIKLDVENAGARFLLTIFFYVVHEIVYFMIARGLVGLHMAWSWPHELPVRRGQCHAGRAGLHAARPRQAANVNLQGSEGPIASMA